MSLVSSGGSIPGLDGRISADPITLRKVTSESVDNSCIVAWVFNIWVSEASLTVFRALTACSSLKSVLNWAMIAEASDREDRKLVAEPGIKTELDVATVGVECKVRAVSPKLGSDIDRRLRQKRLTGDLARRRRNNNRSSPHMWPLITLVETVSTN